MRDNLNIEEVLSVGNLNALELGSQGDLLLLQPTFKC